MLPLLSPIPEEQPLGLFGARSHATSPALVTPVQPGATMLPTGVTSIAFGLAGLASGTVQAAGAETVSARAGLVVGTDSEAAMAVTRITVRPTSL